MNSPSPPTQVPLEAQGNLLLFPEETANSADARRKSVRPAARSQPTSALPTLAFTTVLAAWQPLVRRLGRRCRVLESILNVACPLWISGGTLVVGFAADRQFHRELLDVPEYRRMMEDELARRFGVDLTVVTKLYPESRRPSTRGRPPA